MKENYKITYEIQFEYKGKNYTISLTYNSSKIDFKNVNDYINYVISSIKSSVDSNVDCFILMSDNNPIHLKIDIDENKK